MDDNNNNDALLQQYAQADALSDDPPQPVTFVDVSDQATVTVYPTYNPNNNTDTDNNE